MTRVIATIPLLALLLVACDVDREEIARIPSPDKEVDVMVHRMNAGATVAYFYHVYLAEKNKVHTGDSSSPRIDCCTLVMTVDHPEQWAVGWRDDNTVVVAYDSIHVVRYVSEVTVPLAAGKGERKVSIQLHPREDMKKIIDSKAMTCPR